LVDVLLCCYGGEGGTKEKNRVREVSWVWNFAKGLRPQSTQGMSLLLSQIDCRVCFIKPELILSWSIHMGDAVEIIFLWFERQEEEEEEEEEEKEERENLKCFSQDLFVSYNQKLCCCSSCREQQIDLFPQCLLHNNCSYQLGVENTKLDCQHPSPPQKRQSHIPVAKLGSVSS
jgi:hypothetical protein